MATYIFVYWSDGLGGRAFDSHSRNRGGGGHLLTKVACRDKYLTNFIKCPVFAPGFARGMIVARIDSHIRCVS